MKNCDRRATAILSILCFASCLAARSGDPKDADDRDTMTTTCPDAEAEYERRFAAIQSDIKSLPDHLWADCYNSGFGSGLLNMSLSPKSGFACIRTGCMRPYEANYGQVKTSPDGSLELTFCLNNNEYGYHGICTHYVPMKWGKQRFLIPRDEIDWFCTQVNSRAGAMDFDERILRNNANIKNDECAALPQLPAQYQKLIVDHLIEATVSGIEREQLAPTNHPEYQNRTTTVRLNVGRSEGIREGMEFRPADTNITLENVTVIEVRAHESDGQIGQLIAADLHRLPPQVGWKFRIGPDSPASQPASSRPNSK